jgi:hypothetical protein
MRAEGESASRLVLYFLVGFFFTSTCVLGINTSIVPKLNAATLGVQTALAFDEERAGNALMLCVWSGGTLVYDAQMRFSHCVVGGN